MSAFIIPVFIISIIVYGSVKQVSPYNCFVKGSKSAIDLMISIFPYLLAIFVMLELFQVSGISKWFCEFVSPFFNFFGIPSELSELIILKNFTGSGSIALIENIYQIYGVDSYISRAASCIGACSDAVFYICAVYFSKTKVQKFGYAIPVAIFTNFLTAIVACALCKIM